MGFYLRMHDYNSLNLINITQNLLHGVDQANPLWFYVPDSLCWKEHTLHFQTLTVGLNELLNSEQDRNWLLKMMSFICFLQIAECCRMQILNF